MQPPAITLRRYPRASLRILQIGIEADLDFAERTHRVDTGIHLGTGLADDEMPSAWQPYGQQQLMGQVFAARRAMCEVALVFAGGLLGDFFRVEVDAPWRGDDFAGVLELRAQHQGIARARARSQLAPLELCAGQGRVHRLSVVWTWIWPSQRCTMCSAEWMGRTDRAANHCECAHGQATAKLSLSGRISLDHHKRYENGQA